MVGRMGGRRTADKKRRKDFILGLPPMRGFWLKTTAEGISLGTL